MTLGKRIRIFRRAAGLSLRQLQALIGNRVTAQAISKYERDESVPSSGVLIALADALNVRVDHIVAVGGVRSAAVDFGKRRVSSRREAARIEASVLQLLDRYVAIEEILGLSTVVADIPRDAPWPVLLDAAEAEHAALGIRGRWGLGQGPIPNLADLLEERGIKVLSTSLSKIGGLAARVQLEDGGAAPVIIVNRDDLGERQRFTLAHELGRMVLDPAPRVFEDRAANRFAGALLVPADALRAGLGRHRREIGWGELFEFKRMFGVSVQMLTDRCRDLGIFTAPLALRLVNEFSRLGWRSPPYREPFPAPRERPGRFERLCHRALSEEAISEGRAAELLGMSISDLRRRMKAPPGLEEVRAEPGRC